MHVLRLYCNTHVSKRGSVSPLETLPSTLAVDIPIYGKVITFNQSLVFEARQIYCAAITSLCNEQCVCDTYTYPRVQYHIVLLCVQFTQSGGVSSCIKFILPVKCHFLRGAPGRTEFIRSRIIQCLYYKKPSQPTSSRKLFIHYKGWVWPLTATWPRMRDS